VAGAQDHIRPGHEVQDLLHLILHSARAVQDGDAAGFPVVPSLVRRRERRHEDLPGPESQGGPDRLEIQAAHGLVQGDAAEDPDAADNPLHDLRHVGRDGHV